MRKEADCCGGGSFFFSEIGTKGKEYWNYGGMEKYVERWENKDRYFIDIQGVMGG